MKLVITVLSSALSLLSFTATAQQPLPPDVQALEEKFQAEAQARAHRPYQLALADLNKKYLESLERARVAAQQKGSLEEALAITAEAERITKGDAMPEDDDKTPESIKSLRVTYRKTLARLEADRAQRLRPLADNHLASLNVMVTQLTRQGRLDEARTVRGLVENAQQERAAGLQDDTSLREFLAGTKWLWYGSQKNLMTFKQDGTIELPEWTNKGLVTGWKVTGKNQVKLSILKGRSNNTTATLEFASDRGSFTGIDFGGSSAIAKSPRVP